MRDTENNMFATLKHVNQNLPPKWFEFLLNPTKQKIIYHYWKQAN